MAVVNKGSKRTDGLRSVEDVQAVVTEIAKKSQTVADLFLLGVLTSLRSIDLRLMRWDELDLTQDKITVRQEKTDKNVVVHLTDEVKALLNRRKAVAGDQEYVFQMDSRRKSGSPVSRSKVHSEVSYAADKLKAMGVLPASFTLGMHSSRKTVATMAYRDGENLAVIATMLGHTSIEHTQRYLSIQEDEVLEVRNRYTFGM